MQRAVLGLALGLLLLLSVGPVSASGELLHRWTGDGDATAAVGGAHGTAFGDPAFTPAVFGLGFAFDGVDDYYSFGDAGDLGAGDFTVAYALRTTATRGEGVLGKRGICSHSNMWDMRAGGGGISFELDEGNGEYLSLGTGAVGLNDGRFHFVAVVRTGETVEWWVDGQMVATGTGTADSQNASELWLGRSACTGQDGTEHFTGVVDDLRIADHADPNLLPPPPPVNEVAPSIPSSGAPGDRVSCDPGTWTWFPSLTYQWLRDGQPIPGATSADYTLTAEDQGHAITCLVTATNGGGVTTHESGELSVPAPPAPAPAPAPTPEPAPTPAPVVPVKPEPTAAQVVAEVLTFPSTRKCVSRRRFRIRLRVPRGLEMRSARVRAPGHDFRLVRRRGKWNLLRGKRVVKVLEGQRPASPVDLRGLPKGRFKVRVRVVTTDGRAFDDSRAYRTCVGKRRR